MSADGVRCQSPQLISLSPAAQLQSGDTPRMRISGDNDALFDETATASAPVCPSLSAYSSKLSTIGNVRTIQPDGIDYAGFTRALATGTNPFVCDSAVGLSPDVRPAQVVDTATATRDSCADELRVHLFSSASESSPVALPVSSEAPTFGAASGDETSAALELPARQAAVDSDRTQAVSQHAQATVADTSPLDEDVADKSSEDASPALAHLRRLNIHGSHTTARCRQAIRLNTRKRIGAKQTAPHLPKRVLVSGTRKTATSYSESHSKHQSKSGSHSPAGSDSTSGSTSDSDSDSDSEPGSDAEFSTVPKSRASAATLAPKQVCLQYILYVTYVHITPECTILTLLVV